MGERSQRHIIVEIQSQTLGKRLWRIAAAFVSKCFRFLANIGIQDTLQSHFPLWTQLFCTAFGNSFHVRFQYGKKLIEVGKRIAHKCSGLGHCFLRTNAVAPNHADHIVTGTALRKTAVAMHADMILRTVHIVVMRYEHLTEIVSLSCLTENLTLQKTDGGIIPARTRTVLVLH